MTAAKWIASDHTFSLDAEIAAGEQHVFEVPLQIIFRLDEVRIEDPDDFSVFVSFRKHPMDRSTGEPPEGQDEIPAIAYRVRERFKTATIATTIVVGVRNMGRSRRFVGLLVGKGIAS